MDFSAAPLEVPLSTDHEEPLLTLKLTPWLGGESGIGASGTKYPLLLHGYGQCMKFYIHVFVVCWALSPAPTDIRPSQNPPL